MSNNKVSVALSIYLVGNSSVYHGQFFDSLRTLNYSLLLNENSKIYSVQGTNLNIIDRVHKQILTGFVSRESSDQLGKTIGPISSDCKYVLLNDGYEQDKKQVQQLIEEFRVPSENIFIRRGSPNEFFAYKGKVIVHDRDGPFLSLEELLNSLSIVEHKVEYKTEEKIVKPSVSLCLFGNGHDCRTEFFNLIAKLDYSLSLRGNCRVYSNEQINLNIVDSLDKPIKYISPDCKFILLNTNYLRDVDQAKQLIGEFKVPSENIFLIKDGNCASFFIYKEYDPNVNVHSLPCLSLKELLDSFIKDSTVKVKTEQPVPVDETIKTEQPVPVDENIKTEQPVPVDENIKAEQPVSVDENIKASVDESKKGPEPPDMTPSSSFPFATVLSVLASIKKAGLINTEAISNKQLTIKVCDIIEEIGMNSGESTEIYVQHLTAIVKLLKGY